MDSQVALEWARWMLWPVDWGILDVAADRKYITTCEGEATMTVASSLQATTPSKRHHRQDAANQSHELEPLLVGRRANLLDACARSGTGTYD